MVKVVSQESSTLLVVEDYFLSNYLKSLLSSHGYRVICTNPSAAQALLESREFGVDALITNTPGKFAEFQSLPVVYTASCPDPACTASFQRSRYLTKPFPPRDLFACLDQLLS